MSSNFDIAIIGSGPGGYVAAIRAAQLGFSVACIEKEKKLGGTCLNIGCIPSKALLYSSNKFNEFNNHSNEHGILVSKIQLDLVAMMKRKENIVKQLTTGIEYLFKKNKISRINGVGSIANSNTVLVRSEKEEKKITAGKIIIATGSKSIEVSKHKIDEKYILSSTGALSLNKVPEKLLVVGGGYIGLEMGSVWSRLGSKVTVAEALDRIVPNIDHEISNHFMDSLKKQGIEFKLQHKVIETIKNSEDVSVKISSLKNEKETVEKYNAVLFSIGREPQY